MDQSMVSINPAKVEWVVIGLHVRCVGAIIEWKRA